MNKRYQYKAKRIDNNDWVFGNLIQDNDDKYYIASDWIIHKNGNEFECFDCENLDEVDGNTICQYIENEDFYENDILFGVEKDEYGSIFSVWYGWIKYDKNSGRIRIIDDLGDWYETDDFQYDKVVGNIFDNKDYILLFKHGE